MIKNYLKSLRLQILIKNGEKTNLRIKNFDGMHPPQVPSHLTPSKTSPLFSNSVISARPFNFL